MYNWKLINHLRFGHNQLNGQKKWGNNNKNCMHCVDQIETTEHFLFHCQHYDVQREIFIQNINIIEDESAHELFDWNEMNEQQLLTNILYPMQEKCYDYEKMNDDYYKKSIYTQRLAIIRELCRYIMATKRFKFAYDYTTW